MEAGRNELGNKAHMWTRSGDAGATETRTLIHFRAGFTLDLILWNKGSNPSIFKRLSLRRIQGRPKVGSMKVNSSSENWQSNEWHGCCTTVSSPTSVPA